MIISERVILYITCDGKKDYYGQVKEIFYKAILTTSAIEFIPSCIFGGNLNILVPTHRVFCWADIGNNTCDIGITYKTVIYMV